MRTLVTELTLLYGRLLLLVGPLTLKLIFVGEILASLKVMLQGHRSAPAAASALALREITKASELHVTGQEMASKPLMIYLSLLGPSQSCTIFQSPREWLADVWIISLPWLERALVHGEASRK
jgi:hypothetical protein